MPQPGSAQSAASATCLPPRPPLARPGLRLPAGACDSHCHVFADPERHPFIAQRSYTPAVVTLDDYEAVMRTFGIERAVLVQPSVYGTDNTVLSEALQRRPERLRGVAVVAPDIPDAALERLHAAGVRGVRINLAYPGGLPVTAISELGRRIAPLGWHVQLLIEIENTPDLAKLVAGAGVPVVIDHFGLCRPDLGPEAPGFQALLRLVADGLCWVKLSAAHRLPGGPHSDDVLQRVVDRLIEAGPARLLWATDWPHVDYYDAVPDDADLVARVETWLPSPALRQAVLIDNPSRLYWSI